jgi:hypothetical protein
MSVYKDEKTGKWYAIFRYRTYEGANKQVKKCGFATKREAKQYEAEFISKMNGSKVKSGLIEVSRRDGETRYTLAYAELDRQVLAYRVQHGISLPTEGGEEK